MIPTITWEEMPDGERCYRDILITISNIIYCHAYLIREDRMFITIGKIARRRRSHHSSIKQVGRFLFLYSWAYKPAPRKYKRCARLTSAQALEQLRLSHGDVT